MHYSAKHSLAIACRLSVCVSVRLSVTLVDQDHTGWKTWKLFARTISPTSWGENVCSTPTSITSGWIESTESHVILGGGVAVCLLGFTQTQGSGQCVRLLHFGVKRTSYIRQVNGVKMADILFWLLCFCLYVRVVWMGGMTYCSPEMYSTRAWKFDNISVRTIYRWNLCFIGFLKI